MWESAGLSQAATVNTCTQFQSVTISSTPSYVVQTNFWDANDSGHCSPNDTTQCMTVDTVTGDFGVTGGTFACSNNVATYPSIYYGCHFGNCSPGSNLPMAVSQLQCVTSSWTIGTTNQTGSDLWDAAYDIWFSPNNNPSNHSAELMIWLQDPPGTGAGGCYKATVNIDGYQWYLYEGSSASFSGCPAPTCGGPPWNYIAYVASSPITTFTNTDILAFINDSVSRCYIQPSWYLDGIEAGNELRTGGVPFYSSGFTASVNCPPTATPTATSTPCGYPGNTCTPTDTPISTPTPVLGDDIPWPNPWDGSQPVSLYHTLSTPADAVHLKVYTLAFRLIYDDGTLYSVAGHPVYDLTWNQVGGNLANGLYYLVIEEWRGGDIKRTILKLLVQR